jgi:anti-anti-sigma factor
VDVKIDVETDDRGLAQVAVRGTIDLESRGTVIEACSGALAAHPGGLVLNLADVEFMDSTGISVLVELAARAEELGSTFTLQNPSKRVVRILEITGLGDAWKIEHARS